MIILLVLCLVTYLADHYYNYINFAVRFIHSDTSIQDNIVAFHAIGIIALTFILVMIAWIQLDGIKKTAHGDFLLRLDESFREGVVLSAIKIIYLLDRESKASCDVHEIRNLRCGNCENVVTEEMKTNLMRIYESTNPEDIHRRLKLSLYLDHLETMAYFVNNEFLTIEDIDGIHGDVIKYHCQLFDGWISTIRIHAPDSYIELSALCKKLI